MNKLLFIDDLFIKQNGIETNIDWSLYNVEVIAHVSASSEAIHLMEEHHPQVIVADVRRPQIQIKSLLDFMKSNASESLLIVLSTYQDFEFAQNAYEQGAHAYLLNPTTDKELIQAVLSALDFLAEKKRAKLHQLPHKSNIEFVKRHVFHDLTFTSSLEVERIKNVLINYHLEVPDRGVVLYGQIDNPEIYVSELNFYDQMEFLMSALLLQLKKMGVEQIFEYHTETNFTLLLSPQVKGRRLKTLCKHVADLYERQYQEIVSLAISEEYNGIQNIKEHYKKALLETQLKPYLATNTVSLVNDEIPPYRPIVIQALKYINENFHENLSIKSIVDDLYVSESYLLHIFKEDVGKTFNQYLTDYRLIIAKKLLLNGKYKFQEIANMVGFANFKYFSLVFKKRNGLSPREYIEKTRLI